jgi:hypothetical protein
MRKNIIGQILLDGKVMGTGFLITDDIVMTVKHNVLVADDCIMDEFKEKEVVFRIDDGDDIVGQTINLIEAIEKGIDCVFIKMNEVLSEDEMYDLVDVENEIVGVDCQIAGFPKLAKGKMLMSANIVKEQEENLIIDIKKQDQLNDYEGLSGSPVIVLGNVIGIIVRQENSERLEALSMKFIKSQFLLCFRRKI